MSAAPMTERSPTIRDGIRAGLPFGAAAALLGLSFGVGARPVLGGEAAIVMSAFVFAGAAQFGSTAVLAAGGGAAAAIITGVLLNARFLAMGVAYAPSLRYGPLRRAVEGQAVVDASWALANRGGGRFDRNLLLGATIAQYPAWQLGTLLGVVFGSAIGDPKDLGLDAIFPAFFLALLVDEARTPRARAVAVGGAAIAVALVPVAPPGLPIIAACLAAVVGAWWRA
jgi:predicted branched-subunit amino acid permease